MPYVYIAYDITSNFFKFGRSSKNDFKRIASYSTAFGSEFQYCVFSCKDSVQVENDLKEYLKRSIILTNTGKLSEVVDKGGPTKCNLINALTFIITHQDIVVRETENVVRETENVVVGETENVVVEDNQKEKQIHPLQCPSCMHKYYNTTSLKRHLKSGVCRGCHKLTCAECGMQFKNKQDKYHHKVRGKCPKQRIERH